MDAPAFHAAAHALSTAIVTILSHSHYGRPEVMEWCDENRIYFVFRFARNDLLRRLV